MGLLDRAMGGDKEERSPEVRALHEVMARARDPSAANNAAFFALLAKSHLWVMTPGPAPDIERLIAQAQLSGSSNVQLRAGRTPNGEDYLPAATTPKRLLLGVPRRPGDDLILVSFRFIAVLARYGGVPVVINPGSVPFAYVAGPALYTFADGGIPDPRDPAGKASVPSRNLTIEPLVEEDVPTVVLDAVIRATQKETSIQAASLVLRSMPGSLVYVVLAVLAGNTDANALSDRLARQIADVLGRENYFAMEVVAPHDPRLAEPGHAVVLVPG